MQIVHPDVFNLAGEHLIVSTAMNNEVLSDKASRVRVPWTWG